MKRKIVLVTTMLLVALVFWYIGNKTKYCAPCNKPDSDYLFLRDTVSSEKLTEDFRFYRETLTTLHPGLYKWHTKEQITALFDSVARLLNKPCTRGQLYTYLSIINNRIGCSHTDIGFFRNIRQYGFLQLPIVFINGSYYTIGDNCKIPWGSKLLSVNDNPMNVVAARLKIYESVDAEDDFISQQNITANFSLKYFLAFGESQDFKIRYEEPGTHTTKTDTITSHLSDMELSARSHPFWYNDFDYDVTLEEDKHTAILKVRTFTYNVQSKKDAFEHFLENTFHLLSLSGQYHNLILDLRNNGGGENDNCYRLYSYLTKDHFYEDTSSYLNNFQLSDKNTIDGISTDVYDSVKRVNYHATISDTTRLVYNPKKAKIWVPARYAFKGNVIVITNARTASASVRLAALLQINDNAKIVGEKPNGSYWGATAYYVKNFMLPNSYITFTVPLVSVKYNLRTYPYPLNAGLQPDYQVPLSINDFLTGKDTQIEFIMKRMVKN